MILLKYGKTIPNISLTLLINYNIKKEGVKMASKLVTVRIANKLIKLAKERRTISYSALCDEVNYHPPRAIGALLGELSEITYEHYKIFISALVVGKDTNIPGPGFYSMYRENNTTTKTKSQIANEERAKIYEADWSNLLDYIRAEVKPDE